MSTPTARTTGSDSAERFVALAQTAAPVATGILAPLLDDGAAMLATAGFAGAAAVIGANYLGRLPNNFPGSDILRAHRSTTFISGLTTGMALGVGTLGGPDDADALLAGALTFPSVPGIVSLGWWAGVALVPFKLRRVLGRRRAHQKMAPVGVQVNATPPTMAQAILKRWGQHISNPDGGIHRHQVLCDVHVYADRWTGRILAPAGAAVSVKPETVSSVFKVPAAWIDINPGEHAGEATITVSLKAPAALDPSTLAGAWSKRVARTGGVMPKTHLGEITDDPNTGGQVARVIANEDLDILPRPDLQELAGALRKSPLLISYEANPNDVRRAIIRTMDENPLEKGHDFQGLDSLVATKNGWAPIGKIVSGYPARLQIIDPQLGALHIVIAGTTGSGKGGAAQVVALVYHANGAAIIYADPKGASNPAIPKMAAYSGLQKHGALGAMRISWWVLQHRIEEAARLELKNFVPSKSRPLVPTILDEASQMLGPGAPNRKEAVKIVKDGASLGRSLGLPWVLINQTMNLDQLGGEQAIRANLLAGGTWLILRTDADQVNLGDLPPEFKGINPSNIPAVWPSQDDALIYDPDIPEDDPRRTFGLGYLAAPGGRPGMMRIDTLEDATPHIASDRISVPEDVPWWGDEAYMEELANNPIPGFEDDSSDEDSGDGPVIAPGVDLPKKKEPTAKEKIIAVLKDEADPLHVAYLDGEDGIGADDFEVNYVERADLQAATGMKEATLGNTLNALVKEGKIHRDPARNGAYAIGPAIPASGGLEDAA